MDKKEENNKKEEAIKYYCTYCGSELPKDNNICEKCGTLSLTPDIKPTKKKEDEPENKKHSSTNSKKDEKATNTNCPNCGAPIKSYEYVCPYCKTELRNIEVTPSIEKFSEGLRSIQLSGTNRNSVMQKLIGFDYSDLPQFQIDTQKNKRIADYIKNYPVPNTKEDLIEFMLLATSNINNKEEDVVLEAWLSKMKQINDKAKLTIKDEGLLNHLDEVYNDNKNEIDRIKKMKIDSIKKTYGIVIGSFLLLPILTLPIILLEKFI